jgi:hypothetical protein
MCREVITRLKISLVVFVVEATTDPNSQQNELSLKRLSLLIKTE